MSPWPLRRSPSPTAWWQAPSRWPAGQQRPSRPRGRPWPAGSSSPWAPPASAARTRWHPGGSLPGCSRTVGTAAALTVLAAAGSTLVAVSLGMHLAEFRALNASLGPGLVGSGLLLLGQIGYLPNAVTWGIAFTLGPGFAFGTGTVVSPTGSALGSLPALPMLAALPPGLHSGVPPALAAATLAIPYLAGAAAGLLMVRGSPALPVEAASLRGLACGLACGLSLGVLAAFAGGPLGDGRLAAIGPSPWQVGVSATLEVGVAAAITAGVANWLRLRGAATTAGPAVPAAEDAGDHVIYLDPWADLDAGDPDGLDGLDEMAGPARQVLADPAALPGAIGTWSSARPGPGGTAHHGPAGTTRPGPAGSDPADAG